MSHHGAASDRIDGAGRVRFVRHAHAQEVDRAVARYRIVQLAKSPVFQRLQAGENEDLLPCREILQELVAQISQAATEPAESHLFGGAVAAHETVCQQARRPILREIFVLGSSVAMASPTASRATCRASSPAAPVQLGPRRWNTSSRGKTVVCPFRPVSR